MSLLCRAHNELNGVEMQEWNKWANGYFICKIYVVNEEFELGWRFNSFFVNLLINI
jgi:hypothetical protein